MCQICNGTFTAAELTDVCEKHRRSCTCEECGRLYYLMYNRCGRKVCYNCSRHYGCCAVCGRFYSIGDLECHNFEYICHECSKEYVVCECGNICSEMRDGVCPYCYNDSLRPYCRNIGLNLCGKTFERIRSSRWYGVEIETDSGRYDKVPEEWGIKIDSSIYGLELVSPLMKGDEGLESIKELYENVKPNFTEECGIHVHVDVRDLNGTQKLDLVRAFENTKDYWWRKVPNHRSGNIHCNKCNEYPLFNESWQQWYDRNGYDRYRWVNFCAVEDHGSVELRILDGAGDAVKWVAMVVNFVESVVNMDRDMITCV